jgi:hypothetical protein
MAGYILLVSIILLVVIIIFNSKSRVKVPHIIAGDADTVVTIDESQLQSNFTYFLDKEVILRPKTVFVGKLIGDSMDMRGLCCNDIVLGKKISDPLNSEYNPGDLLIIKISDPTRGGYGKLKIREFKENIDNENIRTIKYMNSLPIVSRPHLKIDVIAVVDRFIKSNHTLKKILVTEDI